MLTGDQLSLGTVLIMRGDADQVKKRVAAGHQNNFPIHAGSDEVAQTFVAAAPSLVAVESVAYVVVVVAVAEDVLIAVFVAVIVVSVFDAEVPVAAAPVVVSAVPAVAAVVEALFVAVAPVAVVAAVVGNLSVHCNSNSARSDCPELPDSTPLPSSAWVVQKLPERVAARNSQWWTVRAAADLTFQAFVFAERLAAVPSPCPGLV